MSNKPIPVKSKLFNLKEWLTIPEAARHLSILFGEEVSEADVLRLALDRHLKLSVNFVNHGNARFGRVVPIEQAKVWVYSRDNITSSLKQLDEVHLKDGLPGDIKKGLQDNSLSMTPQGIVIRDNEVLELENEIRTLRGIWDLLMIGNERLDIEHEYQMLTGGPEVTLQGLNGALVEREDGQICQLQERFPNVDPSRDSGKLSDFEKKVVAAGTITEDRLLENKKERANRPYNHPDNYFPAGGLPNDSVLVVRTQALIHLQEHLSPEGKSLEPLPDPPLLDATHAFYAKELKIAIEAWTELYEKNPPQHVPQGGHKKYITKWLAENYPSLSQRAVERIATIVNPNTKGGASPTG